jgi:hypothetical protein
MALAGLAGLFWPVSNRPYVSVTPLAPAAAVGSRPVAQHDIRIGSSAHPPRASPSPSPSQSRRPPSADATAHSRPSVVARRTRSLARRRAVLSGLSNLRTQLVMEDEEEIQGMLTPVVVVLASLESRSKRKKMPSNRGRGGGGRGRGSTDTDTDTVCIFLMIRFVVL